MIKVKMNYFRAAALCVSTELTRYYLNGVHIHPHHEKGAVLVGTDGRRLLAVHDPEGECSKPVIVSAKIVKLGSRLWFDVLNPRPEADADDEADWFGDGALTANEREDAPPLLIVDEDGRVEVGAIRSTESALIDGTFPDYRKVIPDFPASPQLMPVFDLGLISIFDKAARLMSGGDRDTRIVAGEDIKGPLIVLFPSTPTAIGVAMPMLLSSKTMPSALPPFLAPKDDTAKAA
jgi:hypothetical protein